MSVMEFNTKEVFANLDFKNVNRDVFVERIRKTLFPELTPTT